MKDLFKKYLFTKYILVSDGDVNPDYVFPTLFSIANLFNIRITKGRKLATKDMIDFISGQIDLRVPLPFYIGFPESVRKLSKDQLLFDQILHYVKVYGTEYLSEAEVGHSLFEEYFERIAFKEETEIKEFVIITEEEAEVMIKEVVGDLLKSTRPLSEAQYEFVSEALLTYDYTVTSCASKNTAMRLLLDTRNLGFASFLKMSDVIKLVDELSYQKYGNENLKKLNLKNQDRKFITKVINELFHANTCDIRTCCEKKAIWNGLLHHIHYKPVNEIAVQFVSIMRGKENLSVYSEFEKAMSLSDVRDAARILKEGKGNGAVLRNLEYMVSRAESEEDVKYILDQISAENGPVLLQLYMKYANGEAKGSVGRTFAFTKHNELRVHQETLDEIGKRQTIFAEAYKPLLKEKLASCLKDHYKDKLGKVYLDEKMRKITLPIQENTGSSGLGILPRGSRIAIEEDENGKKIVRGFTYWELANDIDLSVQGIAEDGSKFEFSWRTMASNQSLCLAYSGDETSGYHGGSEYFDIDVELFKKTFPQIKYLVFCNNVYSGPNFSDCHCKAGYMLRSKMESGEIYEPKTVKSSFIINARNRFAYLFAIDLCENEIVWLNLARSGNITVAGSTRMDFLKTYFEAAKAMNVYDLIAMMASEITENPAEADLIVSDEAFEELEEKDDRSFLRSYDVEKMLALINA